MKVFIANFGHENHLWPACRDRPSVATFEDEDLRAIWLSGDKEAYIAHCLATKKTRDGDTPTKAVASRWFSLAHVVSSTENDLWLHREDKHLWWTVSRPGDIDVSIEKAFFPNATTERIHVLHKPANPWSNRSKPGGALELAGLHPKALGFLFTVGTFHELKPENAAYAVALIEGQDLSPWHSTKVWKDKAHEAGRGAVTSLDPIQRAAIAMVRMARNTVAGSYGQTVERTMKDKKILFANDKEFEDHVRGLLISQEGLCKISGLPLLLDPTEDGDRERLYSLDRIDSSRHYEPKNLQIVCRFINRWKGATDDPAFRRLVDLVRSPG